MNKIHYNKNSVTTWLASILVIAVFCLISPGKAEAEDPTDQFSGNPVLSVGVTATELDNEGTITVSSNIATFSVAFPTEVGVGDVVQYDVNNNSSIGEDEYGIIHGINPTRTKAYLLKIGGGNVTNTTAATAVYDIFRAYTSLANWETQTENTNIDADLHDGDGGDYELTDLDLTDADDEDGPLHVACYKDDPFTTVQGTEFALGIKDWTTGPDDYIRIFTPHSASEVGTSQRHTGTAGTGVVIKPNISNPYGHFYIIKIMDDYIRIEGLELDGSDVSNAQRFVGICSDNYVHDSNSDIRVDKCIIHGLTNSTVGGEAYTTGIAMWDGHVKVSNTVIYDLENVEGDANSGADGIYAGNNTDSAYIYNVTIYDMKHTAGSGSNNTWGIRQNDATPVTVKNVFVADINSTSGDEYCFAGSFQASSTNNASDDGTAPDTNEVSLSSSMATDYFVSANDYHIDPSADYASELIDAATSLASDPNFDFTDDIDGDTRSGTWDIGADEYVAASSIYSCVCTDAYWGSPDWAGQGSEAVRDARYGARHYTSLNAWETARGRNLVAANEIEVCEIVGDDWTSADTTAVTIGGWTTDSTRYVEIKTIGDARHDGVWGEDKYRIELSGGSNLNLLIDYARIEGLQIMASGATPPDDMIYMKGSSGTAITDLRLSHCILRGSFTGGTSSDAIFVGGNTNVTAKIYNNIFYDWIYGSAEGFRGIYAYDGTTYAYNNTFYNNSNAIRESTAICVAKNNIAQNSNSDSYRGTFDGSSDYNIASDGTSTGGGNDQTNVTLTFADIGGGDFHLDSTDSEAIDSGDDDPGSGLFSDDIDGDTRDASWDIGADEYVAGAASSIYSCVCTEAYWGIPDWAGQADEAARDVRYDTRHYTSLNAWETARDRNLVTANEIEVCEIVGDDWTSADTIAVTIDGWTTDSTRYIEIKTIGDARHSGTWDTSKYRMTYTPPGNNYDILDIQEEYVRIDGLQFYLASSNYSATYCIYHHGTSSAGEIWISNSIFKGDGNNDTDEYGGIKTYNSSASVYKIWNNLLYDFKHPTSSNGQNCIYINGSYGEIAYIYNNTIFNCDRGFLGRFEDSIVINNIAYECNDGYSNWGASWGSGSDYNLAGPGADPDIPGSNSKNGYNVTFVNETGDDFHLASIDTGAKEYGTDLSSDSNLSFSDDIDGDTRPYGTDWDIGADEAPPCGYSYSRSITIDKDKVGGSSDLTNFPALINLEGSWLRTTTADSTNGRIENSSGYDIIFKDSLGTQLDHEIEEYDGSAETGGTLVAWVRIPTLKYNEDTVIYMYYGNDCISSSQEDIPGVWDDNYVGVWHLDESPANGVAGHDDSTGNPNDGTPQNFGTTSTSTTDPATDVPTWSTDKKIDGADVFDGTDDAINVGSNTSLDDLGPLTITAWIKPDLGDPDLVTIYAKNRASNLSGKMFRLASDSGSGYSNLIYFFVRTDGDDQSRVSVSDAITPNVWQHAAVTWDGSSNGSGIKLYVDGSEVGYLSQQDGGTPYSDSDRSGFIGVRDTEGDFYTGTIDEVRISNTVRSAGWIETEHNNQKEESSFYDVGDEVECTYSYRREITIDKDKVIGSDHTNFPVLINLTGSWLRTTAADPTNGRIENSSGYDIIFKDTLGTQLDHEIEDYDGSASGGTLVAWVRIPTLSYDTDTIIYMYYGNDCISSSQENVAGVWDSNYKGVWHLGEEYALDFDGIDDYVEISNEANFDFASGDVSVSAWIYSKAAQPDWAGIVSKYPFGSGSGWTLQFHDTDQVVFEWDNGGTFYAAITNDDIPQDEWVYIVGQVEGTTLKIYVNGVLQTVTDELEVRKANNHAVWIGTEGAENIKFQGQIDEVRIWNRALSPTEISELYNGNPVSRTGLVGEWLMDEDPGDTVSDSSGEGNDGNMTGHAATWTPRAKDSTSNDNDGTSQNMDSDDQVPGRIDGSLDFDGSDDYVSFSSQDQTIITISGWVFSDTKGDSDYPRIVAMPGYYLYAVRVGGSGFNNDNFQFGSVRTTQDGVWRTPEDSVADGNWYHVAATYDSSSTANDPALYINGVSQTVTEWQDPPSGDQADNAGTGYVANRSDAARSWDGEIDEVRISDTVRSAGWIETEYNNQKEESSFYDVGDEVECGVLSLADHAAGQETDKFTEESSVSGVELFAFKLTNNEESTVTVTEVQFQLSSVTGIVQGDFDNLTICVDDDNDGAIEAGETTTVGGFGAVNSGVSTMTFSSEFTISASTTVNYILKGDVNNLAENDTVTIDLGTSNITRSSGNVGGSAATSVTHTAGAVPECKFSYRRPITIQHSQVSDLSGDLSNFPVLISLSGSWLKTTANGGHIEKASGYDIIFRDSDLEQLDHEIEDYDGSASGGTLVAWVRIPTLKYNEDTVIYMYYGNGCISSSLENVTGVWDSNYKGVWHLGEEYALDFDGNDDYVAMGAPAGLEMGTNDMTVTAWVKISTNPDVESVIIAKGATGSSDNGYHFRYNTASGGNLAFFIGDGTRATAYSNTGLDLHDNTWYFVAVVADRSADATFYVNGSPSGVSDISSKDGVDITDPSENFAIGRYGNVSQAPMTGSIDDVHIWNRALSPTEISDLYNGNPVSRTGLVGEWLMDEGGGVAVSDSSGQGNNGDMTDNPATWVRPRAVDSTENSNVGGRQGSMAAAVTEKIADADDFDGSDDYVDVSDDDSLDATEGNVTLSAWVKSDTTGRYIIAKDPPLPVLAELPRADLPLPTNKDVDSTNIKIQDKNENNGISSSITDFVQKIGKKLTQTITALDSGLGESMKNFLPQQEEDSAVEINILNVHSQPRQGKNWEVFFTTKGQADLKIIPDNQATIEDDEFVSLSCGDKILEPEILNGDVIYYPNWECGDIGKVVHFTLKGGDHTLRFEFGDQVAYAYNAAAWLGCDAEPADRDGTTDAGGSGYTYIFNETYGDSGYITKIEFYIADVSGGVLDFAVFRNVSGTTFSDDHVVLGLSISNGLNQFSHADGDFDAADLPIESGEYIGSFITSNGTMDRWQSGGPGPGYRYDGGDQISGTPSTTTFATSGNSGYELQIRVYVEDAVPTPTKTNVPYALSTVGEGQFLITDNDTTYTADSSTNINDGKWHYIVGTYFEDDSSMKIYIDGGLEDTNTSFSGPLPTNDGNVRIGADYNTTPANFFNGIIDEARISNTARSAGWIETSYNNQKEGSSFYIVEGEDCPAPTAVSLLSFTATGQGDAVLVEWETAQEIDNLGFNLYRCTEPYGSYTKLNSQLIPGLISSVSGQQYTYTDTDVTRGVLYYYMLEDVDLFGIRTMHGPVCVDWDGDGIPDNYDEQKDDDDSDDDTDDGPEVRIPELRLYEVDFGPEDWTPSSSYASWVKLESFRARQGDEGVALEWETSFEVDNFGFHVYRELDGKFYRITPDLVPGSVFKVGAGRELPAGQSYMYWDGLSGGTGHELYWLDCVELNGGRASFGPIKPEIHGQPESERLKVRFRSITRHQVSRARALGKVRELREKLSTKPIQTQTESSKAVFRRIDPEKPSEPRLPPNEEQWFLSAQSGVKIYIREDGWYRVGEPELVAAGLSSGVDPRYLQLYADGEEKSMMVIGSNDGRFDPLDAIEFYGTGLDTPFTDAHVYWLVVGSRPGRRVDTPFIDIRLDLGKRMRIPRGLRGRGAPLSFPFSLELKERTFYFAALKNGERENFFGSVISTEPVDQLLTVAHPDPSSPEDAMLEVVLQGATDSTHQVKVLFNYVEVGEVVFSGQEREAVEIQVPYDLLSEGDNIVTLTAQGGAMDVSLVDYVRLTYWRTYTADEDVLQFKASGGEWLSIGGFSSSEIQVVDITDPMRMINIRGKVMTQDSGYAITVKVPSAGERTLLAFTEDKIKSPAGIEANLASSWHDISQGVDVIIIGHSDLLESVEFLKQLREQQGWSVVLVDVEDLYDEFNFGSKNPWALKDFLDRAYEFWNPQPRFVLLVGDTSYDPRNYLGFGEFDLVPTKFVDTEHLNTASDDWFVDFDDDGLSEMAVGRLPVESAEEAETVVSKIIAYEGAAGLMNEALLVADINDYFNFEGASVEVRSLLPGDMTVSEILRGQSPTARSDLLNLLNQGQLLVNYFGHGSTKIWKGNLFTYADAWNLTNSPYLPFFVSMTCLNGFFQDPYSESLAEALLKAERGGAVAVWTSSGLTDPEDQVPMNLELIQLLFNGQGLTIGEAVMGAKQVVSNLDIRRTWILFGDPTLRLR